MSAAQKNTSPNGMPFKAVSHSKTADKEALLAALKALEETEVLEAAEREAAERQRQTAERDADMALLQDYRAQLDLIGESLKYVTDKDEVADLIRARRKFEKGVYEIETKYGLRVQVISNEEPTPQKAGTNGYAITGIKIAVLLAACWLIVLFSGDWIIGKYPNAAVYNEVSFQKVLFAFSVFIGGVVSVIMAMSVFFPGVGKYFNPFNFNSLDFFEDFKTLTPWQRNLISLALFFALFLAYVLIASGKLD